MSHTSPASYLVWTVISGLLLSFLLFHLWSFDRFRCLKWNNGPYSGAFKRVMTYSYILSVPLIFGYALGFCIIKYREGFVDIALFGIIPKPYQAWEQSARDAIFPLTLMFAVAWSLEMVTHLEELCFWLFLVNAGSAQQDWFRSLYFRTWMIGSVLAVTYMPLVTIFTRSDPLKSEAYVFLAGSLGSLSLTLWFTPVLWTFPSFLENLRRGGVDINTIVRLTKFHELNTIRVIFRFLFVVPLVILGIDGVRPHTHINESMLWTDFLTVVAGFGCSVSSGITLVIFFPRSIEGEIAAKDAARERKQMSRSGFNSSMMQQTRAESEYTASMIESQIHQPPLDISRRNQHGYGYPGNTQTSGGTYLLTSSPVKQTVSLERNGAQSTSPHPYAVASPWDDHATTTEDDYSSSKLPVLRPNRRIGDDIQLGGLEMLTEDNLSKHNSTSSIGDTPEPTPKPQRNKRPAHGGRDGSRDRQGDRLRAPVNPFVHNFTSPIDIASNPPSSERLPEGNTSRLTFNRR